MPRRKTSASVASRRPGRPVGSRNRASASQWFNPEAARTQLRNLDRELERLQAERKLISEILGQFLGQPSRSNGSSGESFPRRAGRKPRGGGPSMLDLLERIIAAGAPNKGWTVAELRDELAKVDSARAGVSNASSLISSALVQALRAKRPRFIGGKGGRGHARKYKLAPAAS